MTVFGFFLIILFLHWIADFVLQTQWMASNKSKSLVALSTHVATYTAVLAIGLILAYWFIIAQLVLTWAPLYMVFSIVPYKIIFTFVLVNGVLHFITDFFTSKWTRALYAKAYKTQDWHNFFVVIGLDQLIHALTLGISFAAIFPDH